MMRYVLAVLVGMLVLVDVAPAFAQQQDTIVVAQEQRRRTLFDLLFGEEQAAPPPVQQQPRQQQQRRQAPAVSLPPPKPVVEKATDATRLAVFGDSLAIDLSRALERFYAEDPNLVVVNQGVSDSGFVRTDYFDWDKAVTEQIAADSFDLAVVMIGINDRQEISIDGTSYNSLTAQWTSAYQARITSFLGKLRAARKPVIWVGLPPMSKTEYSAALSQISNIQRLASLSGSAEFLDIYERFLGEDGKYSSQGPDVNGQNARMRKDDGIHFSTAGADKLAFYISQTISAVYRGGSGVSIAIADPLAGTDAAAMLRPPYQGLGQVRLLEVAGAVIPISRVPSRASELLTATGVVPQSAPFSLEELMTAPPGRVDAFGLGVDPAAPPAINPGPR
ncbi:DUF459 domain-containing protein [Devosia psychrophila]|uniref:SGNH hydrolase-type esterase domain-containing protein n=1 Tax=Devosia psychrophila TaxID=728005 RepID=A0A0F5PZZ3_9HYPH|nr:DUF459 domain-containing protein [Devosia psychrophila]KKC34247.1 hypothetical protein WH91_04000 [Devosia psychrophila]SFC69942.1 hypothetical protein SAMN04488059_10955 [Devosia psychrophila]